VEAISIPGYANFREIGRGGSATVLAAHHVQLERDVAIKVLRPAGIDEQTRQLFDAERRALGKLPKHPNVVTVFDTGFTSTGDPYLVMELCASGSLASLVKQSGPLGIDETVRVGLKISEALEFAHQYGMIHRDVKPENILISDRGEPVLSDFGIAAVLDNDQATSDGAMSPHYVAPEILRGARPSASTDLYSLGATLFFLLTGRAPHSQTPGERLTFSQIFSRVVDPQYSVDIPLGIDVPPASRRAIHSILTKDVARRLDRAASAIDLFGDAESDLGTSRRRIALPTASSKPFASIDARLSDFDPDATYVRRKNDPVTPPNYATPIESVRLGSSISSLPIAPSANSMRAGNVSFSPGVDEDRTIVASAKVALTNPGQPLGTSTAGSEPNRSKEKGNRIGAMALAALVLLVVVAGVSIAVRKSTKTPSPPETAAPEITIAEGPVTAPIDVKMTARGSSTIELTWTGSPSQSVQYEVETRRGSDRVGLQKVSASQAIISGLDLAKWVPCFQVSAVNVQTGQIASADQVCAELAPAESSVAGAFG
jgi:serine/threonine-protein kinase PknK